MPPTQPVLSPAEWAQLKMLSEFEQVVPAPQGADWWGMVIRPNKIRFTTQNKGEKVYMLIRRHWLSNIGWVVNDILYVLMPIVIILGLNLFQINLIQYIGWRIATMVLLIYYSLIVTGIVRNIIHWYFNLYLITNDRLIAYRFNVGAVSRSTNETRLDLISDVRSSDAGVLAAFFNFGDVTIFTEAERNQILLDDVPKPALVRDVIADLAKVASKYH